MNLGRNFLYIGQSPSVCCGVPFHFALKVVFPYLFFDLKTSPFFAYTFLRIFAGNTHTHTHTNLECVYLCVCVAYMRVYILSQHHINWVRRDGGRKLRQTLKVTLDYTAWATWDPIYLE